MRWLLGHRCRAGGGAEPSCRTRRSTTGTPCARRSRRRRRGGSRARRTAITPSPSAGSSARSCGASPARASARTSARRSREPLGLDFHIGLPERRARARRGDEHGPAAAARATTACSLATVDHVRSRGLAARAFINPPSMALGVNHAAWRAAEIPGANGHGDGARAGARLRRARARRRGGRRALLDAAGIARCREEQSHGADLVLTDPHALRARIHAAAGPPRRPLRPESARVRTSRRRRLRRLRRSRCATSASAT